MIAVRADRTRLTLNGATNRMPATVTGVEYQGASYTVALEGGGASDLSAVVPDAEFAKTPVNVGDQVGLIWSDEEVHQLTPVN
jgi:putative spermidine/putrescine transport system ATP-binding protein